MPAHGPMQMAILFSHRRLFVLRKIVKAHGDFDEHAVHGQKNVNHLARIGRVILKLLSSVLAAIHHG